MLCTYAKEIMPEKYLYKVHFRLVVADYYLCYNKWDVLVAEM